MLSSAVQTLLDRNTSTHLNHPSHAQTPKFNDMLSAIAADTENKIPRICVVTCADPRCVPERYFDAQPGEFVCIRNAGGNIENAMSSILAIDSLIKLTDIVLVKHTDCGSLVFRDEKIREGLYAKEGLTEADRSKVDQYRFGENLGTIEESVKQDLRFLAETTLLSQALKKNVSGFVYDLKDGGVRRIEI